MQSSVDNADYLQNTPDGNETVHVMSMAFYQRRFALDPKNLVLAFTSKAPLATFGKQVKENVFQQCAVEKEKLQRTESSLGVYQKQRDKVGYCSGVKWLSCYSQQKQFSAIPYSFSSNDTFTCQRTKTRIHVPEKSGQDFPRQLTSEECCVR